VAELRVAWVARRSRNDGRGELCEDRSARVQQTGRGPGSSMGEGQNRIGSLQMEQRGQRIAGSSLYRDFCAVCQEPIRVPEEKLGLPQNFCLDCMRKAVHKLAESVQQREAARAAPAAGNDGDETYDSDAEE